MFHDGLPKVTARQLWNLPVTSASRTLPHCTPFALPSNGVIQIGASTAITLTTDVVFQPECTGTDSSEVFSVGYLKDPFYSSTIPMVYVIASATVIAWILVVMLTITPRTSFFGLPNTLSTFANGHGIIGGANGGGMSGLSGGGSRPWLQKVATLFVAISLTIATADTLEVAQRQYYTGFMDAGSLRKEVLGSMEIKITRVISDIFVWLAQVQTLIRLFPRHKEKVLIKWIGFVLIILDTIFSCLNSFLPGISTAQRGRHFVDAIPALSYLFELALGLLYAAWVLYYSLTKRRYAFYHSKMRSISLIAMLSLLSILTPVVFFVTDVSNPDVAGWGDYFRWVGAAAASVVVWEWVERIEALERDDKKDGILGREVFDGDEMLDLPNEDAQWSQSRNVRRNFRRRGHNDENGGGNQSHLIEQGLSGMAHRFRSRHQQSPQHFPLGRAHSSSEPNSSNEHTLLEERVGHVTFGDEPRPAQRHNGPISSGPSPPPQVASPVSRADTTSAASTVYVVRYNQVADVPQPVRRRTTNARVDRQAASAGQTRAGTRTKNQEKEVIDVEEEPQPNRHREAGLWHTVSNPFKRKRTSPPQEIQRARAAAPEMARATTPSHNFSRWDVKNRLGVFTAEAGDRFRERSSSRRQPVNLPVTVIPAQPRGRTWSPDENAIFTVSAHQHDQVSSSSGGATTFVAHGQQSGSNLQSDPPDVPGQVDIYDTGAVQTSSSTSTTPFTYARRPPRADDISPASLGGGNGTVVVPAPPRRSPMSGTTPTPPGNNGNAGASVPSSGSTLGSSRNTPANG